MSSRPAIGLVPDFPLVPPATCGIGVYSRALLTQLLRSASRYRFVVFIGEEYLRHLPELGEQVTAVPVRIRAGSDLRSIRWYLTELPRLAREHRLDLLHVFSGNRRLPIPLAIPTVATVHDIHQHDSVQLFGPSRFLFFRCLLAPLLRRQDHLIAVSTSTARNLGERLGIPPARITTVPNGYDPGRFRVLADGEAARTMRARYLLPRDFLLCVSTLEHPRKNHVGLIRAYQRLRGTTSPDCDLVLAGADAHGARTVHLALAEGGLGESVRVLGPVPGEDLVALYNTARALVHPSTREGFGLPLLEAMACGLPVACSDIPEFREVASDAAVYFDPRDPESIATVVRELCREGRMRDACRARGLSRAHLFSWESTARGVLEVYDRLLRAASRGASTLPREALARAARR